MFESVTNFIENNDTPRNMWLDINAGNSKIYIRKSSRLVEGSIIRCIDIATIEIDEKYQQKGITKKLINEVMEILPVQYHGLYIENVMVPWLAEWFRRQGFDESGDVHCPSFFKRNKNNP